MTILEKKRFLSQYKSLIGEAKRLADEKIRWRSLLNKLSACSDEKTVKDRDSKFARLEKDINDELDKIFKLRSDIERAVNTVEDVLQRQILGYRYIDNMSWVKIMVNTGLSERHMYRLHSLGLRNINL